MQVMQRKALPWKSTGARITWVSGALVLLLATIGNATGAADWGPEDYALATVIFGVAGCAIGYAASMSASRLVRAATIGAILFVVAAIWIEAAVGIFD